MSASVALFFAISQSFAINTVNDGFQVVPDEIKTIVAHDVCKKVWNNSSDTHFVATRSSMEWTNFYANNPADLVVSDCKVSCSNLKKMGSPSGVYSIDIDGAGPGVAQNIYCEMTEQDGGWTRVFHHDTAGGYFASLAAAGSSNMSDPSHNLYSILDQLDNFESLNRYTFMLRYPNEAKKNVWSQKTNPTYDTKVFGYQEIYLDGTDNYWRGLQLGNGNSQPGNGSSSLIDGSVEHSNWYYAVGATVAWSGGIPSSNDIAGVFNWGYES